MKPFRLLDTGHVSAAANMALDGILLDELDRSPVPGTLRFLQFSPPAALVGYHQDVSLEIRTEYCAATGIDVNRRVTGGGSIFFQESALGWELFGRLGEGPFRGSYEDILVRVCRAAAAGLSRLGIAAEFRPRNDIEVQGRKISGTGGATLSRAAMFQGTVLIKNEAEEFLKALRVPVEKLKKREIDTLLERICFLSDLVDPPPSIDAVKAALAEAFAAELGLDLIPGGLTEIEQARLEKEIDYFRSPAWIMSRSRPVREAEPIRSITQTDGGTIRCHLWLAPGGRRIRQALISGDFFAIPGRLVNDLEASLVGAPARTRDIKKMVVEFLDRYDGEILGISAPDVGRSVAAAVERLDLLDGSFLHSELNELFLLNLSAEDLPRHKPKWLLLPYCSKNLDCDFRWTPGCEECGLCEIGDCYDIARGLDMVPITIQSFEHLMTVLNETCGGREGMYVGSCCEAFYAKHQQEMEQAPARGVLVNLDSTTCYDLGKASSAYKGRFENKTNLNMDLIAKTLKRLHAYHR